jgi:hypothetical protein
MSKLGTIDEANSENRHTTGTTQVATREPNNSGLMGPTNKRKTTAVLCRWFIYGCTCRFSTAKYHEDLCSYRPTDTGGEPLWRELVNHVRQDPTPIMDIVAALRPWAREIKAVTYLGAAETPIQDTPYYVDVSSWWSRGIPDTRSVHQALLPTLKRQLGDQQCQLLLDQLRPESRHVSAEAVRLLNIASPRNMVKNLGLKVPEWVRLPAENVLWNITPKGAYTELHTDRGLDTVTFQVGGRKIWILYEPDPPASESNQVRQRQSKFFQLWAAHFAEAAGETRGTTSTDSMTRSLLEIVGPELRRPYIAVTERQQGLFVPAGWRHAVFTMESGLLGGYSFCTHQHLDEHVRTLLSEMTAAISHQSREEFDAKTDHLLPDLWQDLDQSFAYVLVHLTEIWQAKSIESTTAADQLWQQLNDFVEHSLPAMKAKNRAAIKTCIKQRQALKPRNRKQL